MAIPKRLDQGFVCILQLALARKHLQLALACSLLQGVASMQRSWWKTLVLLGGSRNNQWLHRQELL